MRAITTASASERDVAWTLLGNGGLLATLDQLHHSVGSLCALTLPEYEAIHGDTETFFAGFSTASPVCVALPRPNETGVSDRT